MKYVGQYSDPKHLTTKTKTDAIDTRVTVLENKTNTIFTTVNETFDDTLKIDGINTTAILENGYMRASYENRFQDLFNDSNYLQMPDADAYTDNGKLIFPTVSGGGFATVLTKQIANFDNTNQVSLSANVAFNPSVGIKRDEVYSPSQTSVIFTNRHKDSGNNVWTFYWSNAAAGSGGGLYLSKNGSTPTRVYTLTSAINTTLNTKIAIASDATNVYVAFNSLTTEVSVLGFNIATTNAHSTNRITYTAGAQSRVLDMVVVNQRLTLFRSHSTAAPAQTLLMSTINVSSSTYVSEQNATVFSDSTSTAFRTGALYYEINNQLIYYVAFKNISTGNAIRFGDVSPTNATVFTNNTITGTTNGNGTMSYKNGFLHLVYGTNDSTVLNYRTINISNYASTTAVSFGGSSSIYGMVSEFLGNILHVYYANSASTAIVRSTIDTTNTATNTTSALQTVNVDQVNAYDYNGSTFKLITCSFAGDSYVYSYGTVTPELKFQIRKANGTTPLANEQFYTAGQLIFNLSERVTHFVVAISTSYALLPATNSPIEIDSYTVESIDPQFQDAQTSVFISEPLIVDRVIESVLLEATTQNTNNGSITWQVKTSESGSWENVSLNTLQNVTSGSSLRVKATFAPNAGISNVDGMPRILSYAISTKNVVTASDLLPLQVNIMKMGINVNVLLTSQRLNYKNMMIDTFETSLGIVNLNGLTHSNHLGTLTNGTGSSIITYTVVEGADISTVSNVIVVAEHTGTMSFRISRDNGVTFFPVTKDTVFSFSDNTATKDQIVLEATFQPNAVCYGWAYLYA